MYLRIDWPDTFFLAGEQPGGAAAGPSKPGGVDDSTAEL
jgi:hypothetical protein